MIPELESVWKQFEETYQALRVSLAEVSDDRLNWHPAEAETSVSLMVQHIARANERYASIIRQEDGTPSREYDKNANRVLLLQRLDESERSVRDTFERLTAEELHRARRDQWRPLVLDPPVAGPLDALWFGMQMVRHSAYHLGQINLIVLMLETEREPA